MGLPHLSVFVDARLIALAREAEGLVPTREPSRDERAGLRRDGDAAGADLFIAATADQELNLLSACRAKLFGVERSLALSNSDAYAPLIERLGLDGVISAKSNVVSSIVEYLRGGNLTTLHSFFDRGLHARLGGGLRAFPGTRPRRRVLRLGGMGLFDAVITVFMVLAGMNFSLFHKVAKGKLGEATRDSELRAYLAIFLAASLLIALDLVRNRVYGGLGTAFRYGAFQSASILTTTGFATADFDRWPQFSRTVLIALMFIGGCSGSTAGGIKVVRYQPLFKQAATELKYLVFPRGVFAVRLNGQPVRKMMIFDAASFLFLYVVTAMACTLVASSAGYGFESSFTATLAALGNIGLGLVGPTCNYSFLPDYATWALSFAMLAGRLELYTVFVLFSPEYRRR